MLSFWDEKWKPCPEFEWGYWVSDFGRVRGPKKMLSIQLNNKGYQYVTLYKKRSVAQHRRLISRLVAMAFIGLPPSSDSEVHHKDGNPMNNHIDNLEWVSPHLHSRAGVRTD